MCLSVDSKVLNGSFVLFLVRLGPLNMMAGSCRNSCVVEVLLAVAAVRCNDVVVRTGSV